MSKDRPSFFPYLRERVGERMAFNLSQRSAKGRKKTEENYMGRVLTVEPLKGRVPWPR